MDSPLELVKQLEPTIEPPTDAARAEQRALLEHLMVTAGGAPITRPRVRSHRAGTIVGAVGVALALVGGGMAAAAALASSPTPHQAAVIYEHGYPNHGAQRTPGSRPTLNAEMVLCDYASLTSLPTSVRDGVPGEGFASAAALTTPLTADMLSAACDHVMTTGATVPAVTPADPMCHRGTERSDRHSGRLADRRSRCELVRDGGCQGGAGGSDRSGQPTSKHRGGDRCCSPTVPNGEPSGDLGPPAVVGAESRHAGKRVEQRIGGFLLHAERAVVAAEQHAPDGRSHRLSGAGGSSRLVVIPADNDGCSLTGVQVVHSGFDESRLRCGHPDWAGCPPCRYAEGQRHSSCLSLGVRLDRAPLASPREPWADADDRQRHSAVRAAHALPQPRDQWPLTSLGSQGPGLVALAPAGAHGPPDWPRFGAADEPLWSGSCSGGARSQSQRPPPPFWRC